MGRKYGNDRSCGYPEKIWEWQRLVEAKLEQVAWTPYQCLLVSGRANIGTMALGNDNLVPPSSLVPAK